MIYIDKILFPEINIVTEYYPYKVFKYMGFTDMPLKPITMLYGNNGSGKSTILNVIGELIGAQRKKQIFKDVEYDNFGQPFRPFENFVREAKYTVAKDASGHDLRMPTVIRLITSDDIFKDINARIDFNYEKVNEIQDKSNEYYDLLDEGNGYHFPGLYDLDHFHQINKARSKRTSRKSWADEYAGKKKELQSNGETALAYFSYMIEPDGIYLLDEPENCLSPIFQIELMKMIDRAVKQMHCQFFIATHSPLILSMEDALIYNLDLEPVETQKWEELENVRIYWEFFDKNSGRF